MKSIKFIVTAVLTAALLLCCSACSSVAANTVFKANDLYGKKIGVQLGTTGDTFATDSYTNENKEEGDEKVKDPATMVRYKTGNEAVMALKQGKIDAVIIDSEPAKAFVELNSDLKILDDPFVQEEYAICFKKGSELTAEFNKALAALKANGTFDKILKNFIGDDAGKTPYVTPEGTDHSKGKLIMATNAFFKPYEYYNGQSIEGIDPSMAQAICDYLGYELEIQNYDFNAILGAVQSGKADFGMAGMTVTEDRKKSVDFSDSYTTATQVIIVRAK